MQHDKLQFPIPAPRVFFEKLGEPVFLFRNQTVTGDNFLIEAASETIASIRSSFLDPRRTPAPAKKSARPTRKKASGTPGKKARPAKKSGRGARA